MQENGKDSSLDVYLYGMTVWSNIHLLADLYPEADTYQEIKESYTVPGGETGNSAIVLANLGYNVKIDGPFMGTCTKEGILNFFSNLNIDCSNLHYDQGFEGVQDIVLIDKHSRTVFGKFNSYFSGKKRWTQPDKEAIRKAKIVALDPFFGEESKDVARICSNMGKEYVTIDCEPESEIHKNSAATIISSEFIKNKFQNEDIKVLFRRYLNASQGLVIFTFGAREILYGRKHEEIKSLIPYKVDVKSTLGAGDTFRAGVVYGLLNDMNDEGTVKFAAATAATVCTRFPMAFNPPQLNEIMELIALNK